MQQSVSERPPYALTVAQLLWPPPAEVRVTSTPKPRRDERVVREWLLLPNPRRATMLVPTGVPGASRMLQRHGDRWMPRRTRGTLAALQRSGQLSRLPVPRIRVTAPPGTDCDNSLESRVSEWVPGTRAVGVLLGTPRINRKPVLQVFGEDGSTLGFVKVGMDDYTNRLVEQEHKNLLLLQAAHLRSIEVPRVLFAEHHDGRSLLGLSPLSSSQERRPNPSMPLAEMVELSRVCGVSQHAVGASPFRARLEVLISDLPDTAASALLPRSLEAVIGRWGKATVTFGSWHGDWAPWNMGLTTDALQLWDWERFASDVPIGFDALHFWMQTRIARQRDLPAFETSLIGELPSLLAPFMPDSTPDQQRLALALYLLEIATRYAQASGRGQTATDQRARWAADFARRLSASYTT